MSTKKPSTKGRAGKAAQIVSKWADRVAGAAPWGESWGELSGHEQQVISLVHNVAITLRMMREGLADERDRIWLEQLVKVKSDRLDTVKLALAAQIIRECAERSTPSLRESGRPELVDWGRLCVGMLASEIHGWFAKVSDAEADKLLARYTNTKARRVRGVTKITAAGILVQLNALAGYPFGRSLNSKNVTDAVGRMKL